MKLHTIIFLFCFSELIFCQRAASESFATLLTQGYQLNSLSGYGFENNNMTAISNITNSNPALIAGFNKYSFGFSKQFSSNIKEAYLAGIGYKQVQNWFPQSAGFIIPLKGFNIGLGISQTFNSQLDFGNIPIRTIENPDGTGEFFSPIFKSSIFTPSVAAASSWYNVFDDKDQLSIGAQLNFHFIHHEETILHSGFKVNTEDFSINLGMIYKFPSSIQLALLFEKGMKFSRAAKFESKELILPINGDRDNFYQLAPFPINVTGYIPDKITLGLLFQPTDKLKLSENIMNVFWNGYQENIHDQIEISSNIIYSMNESLVTSFGIYLTNRQYFGEVVNYFDFGLNAVFLSAGVIFNINNIDVEFVLADSHLFSDEFRKQTLIKAGLNFNL